MIWLFLLLSTAFAQDFTAAPRPEFRQENAYQLLLQLRSGVPVLNSSPTYRGKPTFDNGIIFGDGTEQTTAAQSISVSSVNLTGFTEASANTCLTCVTGSTLTVTGSAYRVCYQGNYGPDAGASSGLAMMGFLVDGACPEGHTCNATLSSARLSTQHEWTTNAQGLNMSFCSPSIFSTSDTRDFCLLACNNQAGGTLGRNSSAYFWVESLLTQ